MTCYENICKNILINHNFHIIRLYLNCLKNIKHKKFIEMIKNVYCDFIFE